MKTNFLVYSMLLTDQDFIDLEKQGTVLRKLNFDRLTRITTFKNSVIYYLAHAILDIQELLGKKNNRGYTYNSYVLNLAIIKLTFVCEIINAKGLPYLKEERDIILNSIKILTKILDEAYELKFSEN